jgi:hypothetical protein
MNEKPIDRRTFLSYLGAGAAALAAASAGLGVLVGKAFIVIAPLLLRYELSVAISKAAVRRAEPAGVRQTDPAPSSRPCFLGPAVRRPSAPNVV